MRHSFKRGLVLAALAGTALVATAPAAFAQTTSPEAFGIEATGLLAIPPTPDATLANPGPLSAVGVTVPGLISTGALTATVTTNSATSSVASLGNPLLGLGITGGAVTASCLANSDGTFVRTSTIASLDVAGVPVTIPNPITPNFPLAVTIPGVASITLNYQAPGPLTGSVTEDAIHIALLTTGEVINVADATCGPFAADTPVASGKGLAIGLGLLGSVGVGYGAVYTRRRKATAL